MGHELYYKDREHHIGNISIRRWQEIGKLFPLLVDFVNRAMQIEWASGVVRDVTVFADGLVIPKFPPPDDVPPVTRPFSQEALLSEEWLEANEVFFDNGKEWDRLFAWCDFLAARDGAYGLYRPLVETLRPYLAAATNSLFHEGST